MMEDYICLLKELLLNNIGNMSFYHEYKKLYSEEEWPDKRDAIFSIIPKGNYGANAIYYEEDRFDLLMDNIEAGNDAWSLREYEAVLFYKYPDRCINILVREANNQVVRANKRSSYRHLADTIRQIKRCPGGKSIAEELVRDYYAKYPRRHAMIEELERL